jgi:hypothetical protein
MRILIDNHSDIDTERDFSPAERHVLQKLFGWKSMVNSVEEFRQHKVFALKKGWGMSGAIRESRAMQLVTQQLEKEIRIRMKTQEKR